MSNYKLVNPFIRGNLVNSFTAKTPIEAASQAWNKLSQYITNNVPKFPFTLQKQDGTLNHFIVKESLVGGNSAKYKISQLDLDLKQSEANNFKNKINKMKGGLLLIPEDDDDDDDDDDIDDDLDDIFSAVKSKKFNYLKQPITYWWYDPLIYQVDSIYIPTFVQPLTPYIEVATINYYP